MWESLEIQVRSEDDHSRLLPGHLQIRDIGHLKKEGLNCYNFLTRGQLDAPVRRTSL